MLRGPLQVVYPKHLAVRTTAGSLSQTSRSTVQVRTTTGSLSQTSRTKVLKLTKTTALVFTEMNSCNTRLTRIDISRPVLQSATDARVSPSFRDLTQHSSTEDLLNQLQQKQPKPPEEDAVQRFQKKYASLDHVPPSLVTAPLSIANIEADAVRSNGSSAFSDTSSDVSDITSSVPASGPMGFVLPLVAGITEDDINQVEIFYRSHKTEVKVCRTLANLYVSAPKLTDRTVIGYSQTATSKDKKAKNPTISIDSRSPDPSDIGKDEWEFSKTGIPVLVLDTGEHVRQRRLSLILAEKGTGFTLWQDQMNHMTRYSTPHTHFHTVSLSTDTTRLIGFSFDDGKAATEFAEAVRSFTANPDDELLNLSNKKKKQKKEKKSKQKYKPPKKVDISQPCCFVHVTKLERPNLLGGLFPPPPSGAELDQLGITRAMSESSGISEGSTTPSVD
ncbi:hypothetical protein Btru_039017 [Bulinus truncatus]|nr:hypothetical protein Btru_039017 [Bulinus truncatus]